MLFRHTKAQNNNVERTLRCIFDVKECLYCEQPAIFKVPQLPNRDPVC